MKRISLPVVFAAALIASTPAKADGLTQFALELTGRAVFLVAKLFSSIEHQNRWIIEIVGHLGERRKLI